MKNLIIKIGLPASLFALITACTPNISPDVIQSTNANEVTNTVPGKIVNMKVITVKGTDNSIGMIAGGAAGAVAGSAIGGGDRMPILGGIGGALLGGAAGNAIQDKMSSQQGMQYIVRTGRKHYVTVVQSLEPAYSIDQCVFVVEGAHARITSAAADSSVCDDTK